jgi:hypothetical protein
VISRLSVPPGGILTTAVEGGEGAAVRQESRNDSTPVPMRRKRERVGKEVRLSYEDRRGCSLCNPFYIAYSAV